MELHLKGKTVVVTGGSRGIGVACAAGFAAEGCRLHLVSRSLQDLEAARHKIVADSDVAVTVQALDLGRRGAVAQVFKTCPDADIVVNNAGAIPRGDIDAIDEERWREAWDLKVFGYVNMCRQYYRRMRERGDGVIVNVLGTAGERLDVNYITGTAGNASLMAFTRALGSNSLRHGVRVVGVNPGPIMTDRWIEVSKVRAQQAFGDPSRWSEFQQNFPLKRAGKPEEVADVVVFLASERASFVSGTIVTVDSGLANSPR
ncbi:MAG: SDR family oxidoreductase [Candidatus Lambdaproteobacteria bacterium]|nr:SDR family oxidoreductase [Candidatus Lambdaproteobacteria bacterium]